MTRKIIAFFLNDCKERRKRFLLNADKMRGDFLLNVSHEIVKPHCLLLKAARLPETHAHSPLFSLVLAHNQNVRGLMLFRKHFDFRAHIVRRKIGVRADVGREKSVVHLPRIIIEIVGDRNDRRLLESEPCRKSPGKILNQDAQKSLEASKNRPMKHDRMMLLIIRPDVGRIEPLRARQLKIGLNRAALPFPAKTVIKLEFKFRPVERPLARLNLIIKPRLTAGIGEGFLRPLPCRKIAHMIIGHRGEFHDQIIESKIMIDSFKKLAEFSDLRADLLLRAKDMGVVLNESSHAHHSVQCSAGLVSDVVPEFRKTQRQILVRALTAFENLQSSGAVHRLDREQAFLALRDEHIALIMLPMTAPFPKTARHNRGGAHLLITVTAEHFPHIILNRRVNRPAVGMPVDLTGILRVDMEQIHLGAKFAVIALLRLREHRKIISQIVRFLKTKGIDTREHGAVRVAAPIRSGDFIKLESLRVDFSRAFDMRPTAQIKETVLLISRDDLALRQILNQLDFIWLVRKNFEGILFRDFFPDKFRSRRKYFSHLFLDCGKIIFGQFGAGGGEVEIIVKPVVDRRTDRNPHAREQMPDGLRHNVRARVARCLKFLVNCHKSYLLQGIRVPFLEYFLYSYKSNDFDDIFQLLIFLFFFADTVSMENGNNFTETLIQALDAKAQWYDSEELPRILENYRLMHACVKVIYEFLIKKALISPDPYKLDKKISDIKAPENTPFAENERSVVIDQRFSDYESTLDFLCNYYKFSVSQLSLGNIKKLVELNNSIVWNSFSANSNNINTRVLASLVFSGRQGSDGLTSSMLTDNLSKASHALSDINSALKEYTEFQKEWYKGNVRRQVMTSQNFDANKAFSDHASELQQIKRNFAAGMGKAPFYSELIEEIIQEDQGEKKEELRQKVLAKLNIEKETKKKVEKKVDTKAMIMKAVQVLGSTPPQLAQIVQKIQENHDVLESEHNSFMDKLKRSLRKAFGIQEKPLFYTVSIVDQGTGSKRNEKIAYQNFMTDLTTKSRRYAAISQTNSPGYQKLLSMPEEKIAEFVTTQITECNKLMAILGGLDDFFKGSASIMNKSKIKGLKIDITTLKNSIVKANQLRVEYTSFMEEEMQMKQLGITG